jgi:hypothetical protein
MRIALLFDIHANLPALEAVLAEVDREGIDAILHGGDLVGWGPQPNEVVDLIAERGIAGVVGNHELLCLGRYTEDHALRNASTAWTASVLTDASRRFIAELPAQRLFVGFLLSHASPAAWHEPPDETCFPYRGTGDELLADAERLRNAPGGVIVTGHLHVPGVYASYFEGGAIEVRHLEPSDEFLECSLGVGEWLFVAVGAVGKPRDGVPAANYALMDEEAGTITLRRVPYDLRPVCDLICRTPGLPSVLADELAEGL